MTAGSFFRVRKRTAPWGATVAQLAAAAGFAQSASCEVAPAAGLMQSASLAVATASAGAGAVGAGGFGTAHLGGNGNGGYGVGNGGNSGRGASNGNGGCGASNGDCDQDPMHDRLDELFAKAEQGAARRRRMTSTILRALVYVGAAITSLVLAFLVGYILVNGVPYLTPSLFEWTYTSDNVSLMPALVGTLAMAALALVMAVPVGVGSAIYLVEYASRGSKFVTMVRTTTETLQGIPSIVYGLFGMLFFVTALGWGLSLLSGACTLAIMVLPVVMRTTEEALLAVPDAYREGGFGLGAGRLRTVFRCVLPSAIPGILGGVILALGRCVGEVAALLFTAGTIAQVPDFAGSGAFAVFDSCRTLAVHMYVLASEGLHVNETYATAVVLLVVVVLLNMAATFAAKRMRKGSEA